MKDYDDPGLALKFLGRDQATRGYFWLLLVTQGATTPIITDYSIYRQLPLWISPELWPYHAKIDRAQSWSCITQPA